MRFAEYALNKSINKRRIVTSANNTKRFYDASHLIKGFEHIASRSPVYDGSGAVVALNGDDPNDDILYIQFILFIYYYILII